MVKIAHDRFVIHWYAMRKKVHTMQDSKRSIVAWAFYDWANSAFATTVMAGFFPVFFSAYWAVGASSQEGTFYLGLANSLGSLIVALLAPTRLPSKYYESSGVL